VLTSPVDIFPTLCRLCDLPIPRTIEGCDLADAWRGVPDAFEQEAVLTMNFSAEYDYLADGHEWRGVRTKRYSYARWLTGDEVLYDLVDDPLQMHNLANSGQATALQSELETTLGNLMAARQDALVPCTSYADWFDRQRRVVRNVYGPMGDPENAPDWSLLG
jgi:arylsulfatase A-like enzyme